MCRVKKSIPETEKKRDRRLLLKELFVACHVSSWMIILLWTDDDDFDEKKRGNCNECYLVITTVFNSTTYLPREQTTL